MGGKTKLSGKQRMIAKQAKPYHKITKADFLILKQKKK